MKSSSLGRLEKVSLRDVFATEAGDFTPWLAQERNLSLLSETIQLDLILEAQEANVGPFRADILCKDAASDAWVLIENQIEKTDHTHLGQLLTYAAGLQAVTIIWIAERFTDEHRATIDWLNERTDEQINFFGLEVELWRIGDSAIAPKFNIVSQPNDWSRTFKTVAGEAGEITAHKQMQLQFWTAFKEFMETNSEIRCQKPAPQHWMNHSIGKSGVYLASVTSLWNSKTKSKNPEIRVELVLTGAHSKQNFESLFEQKDALEGAIGEPLTWHNPVGKNMCRIFICQNADFLDSGQWSKQHAWLKDKLELFKRVFTPPIQNF